jgi:hypothetical protein
MESMDELFIPYKTAVDIPEVNNPTTVTLPSSESSSWSWIWVVAVMLILIVGGGMYGMYVIKSKSMAQFTNTENSLQVKQVIPEVIPSTIDFTTPPTLNTQTMSKEELAKFIGTEIKNLLVLYSGVNSLQTASIVGFSVRTMLEDFAPILEPKSIEPKLQADKQKTDSKTIESNKHDPKAKKGMEKLDEEFISTKVLQPKPQNSYVLDADEEEETKDPPKKGKINADTDTNLLQMLKQRGLFTDKQ